MTEQKMRRWSKPVAARVLTSLQMSPGVLCGNLNDRQRGVLARWLNSGPATRAIIAATEQRRWENVG